MVKNILKILFVLCFSAGVCFLLSMSFKGTKAEAFSGTAVEAVSDRDIQNMKAGKIFGSVNSERQVRGFEPLESDINLTKSALYEGLYISEHLNPMDVFPEHPELLRLKDDFYPFVKGRFCTFYAGNLSDPDKFASYVTGELRNSDFAGEIFGGVGRMGVAAVETSKFTVVVIHISDCETSDNLPDITVSSKPYVQEEFFGEDTISDDVTAPYVYGDNVSLPKTPKEDFYDISNYVSAYDDSGSVRIITSPAFVGPGYEGNVSIDVFDLSGNSSSKVLPVVFAEDAVSGSIINGEGVSACIFSSEGSGTDEISGGMHIVFSCDSESKAGLYKYTFSKEGREMYSFLRQEDFAVWNPYESGSCSLDVYFIEEANKVPVRTAHIDFVVSERKLKPYVPAEFVLSEDSGLRISEEGYLSGLEPGITLGEILPCFSMKVDLTGSEEGSGVTLRCYDRNGDEFAPSEDTVLGTGILFVFYCEGFECLRVTSVVYGDITGDGRIDISDFSKMRYALLGKVSMEDCWFEAANIASKDAGKVDISDFSMMRYHLLGKTEIPQ